MTRIGKLRAQRERAYYINIQFLERAVSAWNYRCVELEKGNYAFSEFKGSVRNASGSAYEVWNISPKRKDKRKDTTTKKNEATKQMKAER